MINDQDREKHEDEYENEVKNKDKNEEQNGVNDVDILLREVRGQEEEVRRRK